MLRHTSHSRAQIHDNSIRCFTSKAKTSRLIMKPYHSKDQRKSIKLRQFCVSNTLYGRTAQSPRKYRAKKELRYLDMGALGAFGGHTPSNTWSLAEDNYFHMRDYANWSNRVNNIYETPQMGLIYTDWTSDHTIDHVMFVIDNIPVPSSSHAGYEPMPIICQKSNNRNAVPLSTEMTYAHKKHPKDTISWFGLSANAKVRFI